MAEIPDPQKLIEEAEQLEAQAEQIEYEARVRVAVLRTEAEAKRQAAALVLAAERKQGQGRFNIRKLPPVKRTPSVPQPAQLPARQQSVTPDPVVSSSIGVRVSIRAIAEQVGISHTLLSWALQGKRRIRRSVAEQVAKLAPELPATRRTYPAGLIEEE